MTGRSHRAGHPAAHIARRTAGLLVALTLLVSACKDFEPAPLATFEDLFLPAPAEVGFRVGLGFIDLSWNYDLDSTRVQNFRIYRSENPESDFVLSGTSLTTSYRDTTAIGNVNLYYRVSAVSVDNVEGLPSETVRASIFESAVVLQEPSRVAGDPWAFNLRWTPADSAVFSSYQVKRSLDPAVSLSSELVRELTAVNLTSFIDTNLDQATTYYYRIYTFDINAVTLGSNIVEATTPVNTPPQPVALSQATDDSSALRLTWTPNSEVDFASYRVFRSTQSPVDTAATPLAILGDQATAAYNDRGALSNTTYFYRVFVFDRFNEAAGSNEVSGRRR